MTLVAFAGVVALPGHHAAAQAPGFDHAALAERARQAFIMPGYQRLQGRLSNLEAALAALCPSPSQDGLDAARAAYRDVIAAWGRMEVITFGPIARANRLDRMFFWPDRKGIGRRQVRRLLAREVPDVLKPDNLAAKSVAVQGLTALELLLHDANAGSLAAPPAKSYRCRFAQSITANLSRIIQDVTASWSRGGAFQKLWAAPGPNNPVYLNAPETSLELIKAFELVMENARDRRIVPAIGFGPKRRVFRPVLWRSGLAMVLIHGNMAGAWDLLVQGGLADNYLKASQQKDDTTESALESIMTDFKLLLSTTQGLAGVSRPFKQPDTKRRLLAVGFPLKSIRQQFVARFKQAAGLSIGFNAADGD